MASHQVAGEIYKLASKGDLAFLTPSLSIGSSYGVTPAPQREELSSLGEVCCHQEKWRRVTHLSRDYSRHLLLRSLGLGTAPSLWQALRTGSTLAL